MSAIKGKNTKPELLVRKFLFSRGFRYRLNHLRLLGHPDILLHKYRTVIFVNGCFSGGNAINLFDTWIKVLEPNIESKTRFPWEGRERKVVLPMLVRACI